MASRNHLLSLKHIVLNVALAETAEEKAKIVVSSVKEALNADACSLYLVNSEGSLVLRAAEGFDKEVVGNVILQAHEGVTGYISSHQSALNTPNPAEHSDFVQHTLISENDFAGYLGVPIVTMGESVGVIAVRSRAARKFSEDDEALLTTLTAHLSHIIKVEDWDLLADEANNHGIVRGIAGSQGIGIGRLLSLDHVDLSQAHDQKLETQEEIDREKELWLEALSQAEIEIEEEAITLASFSASETSSLIEAYQLILSSSKLTKDVQSAIDKGNWAIGSLRSVIQAWSAVFQGMDDPYMRSRSEDIINIGNKLYHHLLGKEKRHNDLEEPVVLLADMVSITDIANFQPDELAGILCRDGSAFSHTAIVAKAIGIPAIMGIGLCDNITENTEVIVDGNSGEAILKPSQSLLSEYRSNLKKQENINKELLALKELPAVTTDGFRISLYANTGLMADVSNGVTYGAEGIGLLRTEMPFIASTSFPTEDEQYTIYRHALENYEGKPVIIRTLDIGGDKPLSYFSFHEENPALGWRGIRFTLDNSAILITQLTAMLRASEGLNNLRIMLPMVSSISEVSDFKSILESVLNKLSADGYQIIEPELGIMVEVPAAIDLIPALKDKISFLSIGSNDLTQYLLAVDRGNPNVADLFDPYHPSVIASLYRIIRLAKEHGLKVGLCGEMGGEEEAAALLVAMGIDSISMSPFQLLHVKSAIRSISHKHSQELLKNVLTLDSGEEIKQAIAKYLNKIRRQS